MGVEGGNKADRGQKDFSARSQRKSKAQAGEYARIAQIAVQCSRRHLFADRFRNVSSVIHRVTHRLTVFVPRPKR